jgi:hypothetical protein
LKQLYGDINGSSEYGSGIVYMLHEYMLNIEVWMERLKQVSVSHKNTHNYNNNNTDTSTNTTSTAKRQEWKPENNYTYN